MPGAYSCVVIGLPEPGSVRTVPSPQVHSNDVMPVPLIIASSVTVRRRRSAVHGPPALNSESRISGQPAPQPSIVTGTVFVDGNKNGVHDAGEVGIGAVKVTLTGTDSQGAAVNVVEYTKSDGSYLFGNLKAGKYAISET